MIFAILIPFREARRKMAIRTSLKWSRHDHYFIFIAEINASREAITRYNQASRTAVTVWHI